MVFRRDEVLLYDGGIFTVPASWIVPAPNFTLLAAIHRHSSHSHASADFIDVIATTREASLWRH